MIRAWLLDDGSNDFLAFGFEVLLVHDLDKKIFILIQQKSSIGLYQQIILFWTMIEQPLNLNIQIF